MKKTGIFANSFPKLFMGKLSRYIDSFPAGEPYKYLRKSPKVPHPSHIRKAIASIDQTTVFQWSVQEIPLLCNKRQIETAALSIHAQWANLAVE